jgi:hypothetical protein
MTEQLADLLDQYLCTTKQPAATVDREGLFTIETSAGLLVGATMLPDGRLELYSNPGHVGAATLHDIIEDDEEPDDDDIEPDPLAVPGALVRWQAGEDHWGIHVDRASGLVTLTSRSPRNCPGMSTASERCSMRSARST